VKARNSKQFTSYIDWTTRTVTDTGCAATKARGLVAMNGTDPKLQFVYTTSQPHPSAPPGLRNASASGPCEAILGSIVDFSRRLPRKLSGPDGGASWRTSATLPVSIGVVSVPPLSIGSEVSPFVESGIESAAAPVSAALSAGLLEQPTAEITHDEATTHATR